MITALFVLLCGAALSGLWVWMQWRQRAAVMDDVRPYVHGALAALVLVTLVMSLDQNDPEHGWRLLAIFLTIATGMLLFLKRQRQHAFPGALMALHIALGAVALGVTAWALMR